MIVVPLINLLSIEANTHLCPVIRTIEMFTLFSLAVFISYVLLVLAIIWGWTRARSASHVLGIGETPMVSIVVAARNEARRISPLLDDLRKQKYQRFEVIVVDDHSDDNTVDVCRRSVGDDTRFTVIRSRGTGKKSALTQGVEVARGSIILTTDADCRVGPLWIQSMCSAFADSSVMFCFGGVAITGDDVFGKMQAFEFAALVGSAAATAALHAPTMCNGANMAYRRTAFIDVKGYAGNEAIASGDDEFLMRKILEAFPGSVRCWAHEDALVTTVPAESGSAFIDQRLRWAGKWKANSSIFSSVLAVYIFGFHLCVVLLPLAGWAGFVDTSVVIACLVLKGLAEWLLLFIVRPLIRVPWSWSAFFILQFVHSFYVVLVAVCAQFASIEWKGRRLKALIISNH